eukprot:NODE_1720_length_1083_cov_172.273694_g1403_i0.p2 GENE.NODE_1720_length_1083_cov_172.273694_g1403_i0~~NODE_1720_length_1083_cov_172.273694_g1403_i0.p2  ORF type:complete len:197 (-),score=82.82 NODE_1720_length_1083_cov_172.273694_g1403_i0:370-960(-)
MSGVAEAEKQSAWEENQRLQKQIGELDLQLSGSRDEVQVVKEQAEGMSAEIERLKEQLRAKDEKMQRMQQAVDELTGGLDKEPSLETKAARHQRSEVLQIIKQNPNCVPIRCVRADNCTKYPLLEKKKFAAPKDMTLSRFNEHIRTKLKLGDGAPLSVYVECEGATPPSEVLEDVYTACKQSDGFLHLRYTHASEV